MSRWNEWGSKKPSKVYPDVSILSPSPEDRFHQWLANLRVLEVAEIKTVPYVPLSHPFVERLIGTLRRECLDRTLFWTSTDLEAKLLDFQQYYNEHRTHAGRQGHPPVTGVNADRSLANLSCSIEGEVKKKYVSDRWSLSCFQPHLLEQGRF